MEYNILVYSGERNSANLNMISICLWLLCVCVCRRLVKEVRTFTYKREVE